MLTQATVLNRISKLLAIQEARGATEAEAQIAAGHVQKLLQDFNLTLSEVERHGGGSDQPSSRKKDEVSIKNNNMPFLDRLCEGVAGTNFCLARVSVTKNEKGWRRKRVVLIGREVNVRATRLTFDYLVEACFREMQGHEYRLTTGKAGEYSKDALYFLEGMANRVVERLQKLQAEREAESAKRAGEAQAAPQGNGTHQELVLSDVYGSEQDLNNDFLNGFPAGTTASRRRAAEEKEARINAEYEKLKSEGMEWVEAWCRARGYGDQAVQYAHAYHRSSRRSGRSRGYSHGTTGSSQREYKKVNSTAYQNGRKAGSTVSLDQQVGRSATKQIGSK